ncbi:class I SAM-dependent methyltransferase, partial [Candidatus Bathyarchaeota archaeon]|nr:class I SAM-dependent methyltransferase [Candidatus Bathyarchaeota archaeon]
MSSSDWLGVSQTIRVFNEASENYDSWYETPMGRYALSCELEGLKRMLPQRGIGIDVGAGTGIFAEHLSDDRIIICLDPSPGMLRRAARRGLPSILGVAEHPPLRPRCLDFIYMVATLEFLPEPIKALEALRISLKPHGSLILLIINTESPWGRLYLKLGEEGDPIFSRIRLYNYEDALKLLKEAGLKLLAAVGTLM